MRKDIIALITIVTAAAVLIALDYPRFVNILKNENLYGVSISTYFPERTPKELVQKEKVAKNEKVEPTIIPPTSLPTPTPTPDLIKQIELPVNFLLLGDSMMLEGFGPKLQQDLLTYPSTEVTRYGKYSSGLNRIDYYNWQSNSESYINQHNPDILVVYFGSNDGQNILDYNTGLSHKLNTPGWDETYRARVRDYLDMASPKVKQMYWIGQPIASTVDFQNKFRTMNAIYAEEIANYSNVKFVPTWDRFAENDRFAAYVADDTGKRALVKAQDGVHVTWHGATILSQELQKQLVADIPQLTVVETVVE